MKVQEKVPVVHLEEFDIDVNKYLTYAQIQNIVNSTLKLMNEEGKNKDGKTIKYNSWSDRQQSIDMLVLYHATNLTEEELNSPHSMFLQNGIIDAVNRSIENYWQIAQAFEYTDGMKATVLGIIEGFTAILKHINPKTLIKKDKDGTVQK